jgi:cobaltochelatase CobT
MSEPGAVPEEPGDDAAAAAGYRVYTKRFDVVTDAAALDAHLGGLGPDELAQLERARRELEGGLAGWRTKVHLLASEADARIRARLPDEERAATIVTLLFDQSGSMRGQKMLFAAATADVVREFVVTLGMRCEVLGFTTVRWRGGKSRRRWRWRLRRPRRPGRLNDLLHIVYREADDVRASAGGYDLRQMLRYDLPKENIDGEAVEWAAERLLARPEARKLLVLLSDGAPVDDSTLAENGPDYLGDHLRAVVGRVNAACAIELAAMGIGYATHDYYRMSGHVEAPADVGEALVRLLERMLLGGPSGDASD